MGLLSLLGSGHLAGTNSPDGLVGNDNLGPVGLVKLVSDSLELTGVNLAGLAGLALLKLLTDAKHHSQALVDGRLRLDSDVLVSLVEEGAPLRVASQSPANAKVLHLAGGDIAGVSAVPVLRNILGGNVDVVLDLVQSSVQVDIGGRNDHGHFLGVVLSLVESLLGEGVEEGHVSVRLPVTTDDVLTLNISPSAFSGLGHSVHRESGASIPISTVDDAKVAHPSHAAEGLSGGGSSPRGLLKEVIDDTTSHVCGTLNTKARVVSLGLSLLVIAKRNGGLKWGVDCGLKSGSSSLFGICEAGHIAHAGSLALNARVIVLGRKRLRILNILGGGHNKGILSLIHI